MIDMRSDNPRLGRLGGAIFIREIAFKRCKWGSVDAKSMIVRGKKGRKKFRERGSESIIFCVCVNK